MRRALTIGAAALIAGCASGHRYTEAPEKNFVVRAEVREAHAVLGVHAVDSKCNLTYEGYVDLEEAVTRVGIPPGRLSYLVFKFTTSSFWAGRRGSITRETLLRPRPGAVYDVRVTYKDDLYEVAIRETPRGGSAREVPLTGLAACRP